MNLSTETAKSATYSLLVAAALLTGLAWAIVSVEVQLVAIAAALAAVVVAWRYATVAWIPVSVRVFWARLNRPDDEY